MTRFVPAAVLALGLALSPTAASAAGPQPPNCPLYAAHPAVDHTLVLPDGSRLVAHDPYGGLLPRNRLFFDFSVRRPNDGAAPGGVAQVTWALDGRVVHTDARPPFEWKALSGSQRMPAGDHQITVTVTPTAAGSPVSTTFPLTATDCQPASAYAFIGQILIGKRLSGSQLYATSSFESDQGPTMGS